jgi:hypothetical protein
MSQRCGPSKVGRVRNCHNANTIEITVQSEHQCGTAIPESDLVLAKNICTPRSNTGKSFQISAQPFAVGRPAWAPDLQWPRCGSRSTRSASSFKWGGRGPLIGWYGLLPPASEREARLDDPIDSATPKPNLRNATLRETQSQVGFPPFSFSHLSTIDNPVANVLMSARLGRPIRMKANTTFLARISAGNGKFPFVKVSIKRDRPVTPKSATSYYVRSLGVRHDGKRGRIV